MEINKITNLLNLEHVKFLISIFKENNIEIRLVGGCIRDALLERGTMAAAESLGSCCPVV